MGLTTWNDRVGRGHSPCDDLSARTSNGKFQCSPAVLKDHNDGNVSHSIPCPAAGKVIESTSRKWIVPRIRCRRLYKPVMRDDVNRWVLGAPVGVIGVFEETRRWRRGKPKLNCCRWLCSLVARVASSFQSFIRIPYLSLLRPIPTTPTLLASWPCTQDQYTKWLYRNLRPRRESSISHHRRSSRRNQVLPKFWNSLRPKRMRLEVSISQWNLTLQLLTDIAQVA